MQVSSKIDRRARAAKGGPRAADNQVQIHVFTCFLVILVKCGIVCVKKIPGNVFVNSYSGIRLVSLDWGQARFPTGA